MVDFLLVVMEGVQKQKFTLSPEAALNRRVCTLSYKTARSTLSGILSRLGYVFIPRISGV
jgi:hypothetical protein